VLRVSPLRYRCSKKTSTDGAIRAFWVHDFAGERRAFEEFIDFVHARLARYPDLHVYHYGAYEQSAIKQLMGLYATREDEVDDLLRRKMTC
jgi:uncharacterized protein